MRVRSRYLQQQRAAVQPVAPRVRVKGRLPDNQSPTCNNTPYRHRLLILPPRFRTLYASSLRYFGGDRVVVYENEAHTSCTHAILVFEARHELTSCLSFLILFVQLLRNHHRMDKWIDELILLWIRPVNW